MVLSGKTAIITGAGKGIGAEIARRFASEGANLVLMDIDSEKLSAICDETKAEPFWGNVADENHCEAVVETAVKKFGSLDILVNNAGITRDNISIRMKSEDFRAVLEVNLLGAFLMSKASAKAMMKNRYGKIVNISSVVGIVGNAGQANYAASKGGLIALTRSFAKEFGSRGIRVNAIAPGFIETDMTKTLPESARKAFLGDVLLNNEPGDPKDVAESALFLSSRASDYITGIVLPVDGGMLIA